MTEFKFVPESEKAIAVYREACNKLGVFLDNSYPTPNPGRSNSKFRAGVVYQEIDKYGSESVYKLVKEPFIRGYPLLTSFMHALHINGVYTKDELLKLKPEEFRETRNVGSKQEELLTLVQDLALVEQYVEWNIHNK